MTFDDPSAKPPASSPDPGKGFIVLIVVIAGVFFFVWGVCSR